MPTDVLIVVTLSGFCSIFALGWMMFNLIKVMAREGLSWDVNDRLAQTKEILLKPAILFFCAAGLSSTYLAVRAGLVSS